MNEDDDLGFYEIMIADLLRYGILVSFYMLLQTMLAISESY
jgi:hypothetical protein